MPTLTLSTQNLPAGAIPILGPCKLFVRASSASSSSATAPAIARCIYTVASASSRCGSGREKAVTEDTGRERLFVFDAYSIPIPLREEGTVSFYIDGAGTWEIEILRIEYPEGLPMVDKPMQLTQVIRSGIASVLTVPNGARRMRIMGAQAMMGADVAYNIGGQTWSLWADRNAPVDFPIPPGTSVSVTPRGGDGTVVWDIELP